MTSAPPPTHEADATTIPTEESGQMVLLAPSQMIMDAPPKGHIYLAIPADLPTLAIQNDSLHSLCRVDNGELIAELGSAVVEVLTAVMTMGRKGEIKLTLKIAPDGQKRVTTCWDVAAKPPKEKRNPSPIFCTEHGQLVTRDPDQMEMELKTVTPVKAQPMRTVAPPPQYPLRTVPPPQPQQHASVPPPHTQSSSGVPPVPGAPGVPPAAPPGTPPAAAA